MSEKSESEKLAAVMQQTSATYLPEHRPLQFLKHKHPKIPPDNYICHRCSKGGHYIQHCPTNGDPKFNIKKPKRPIGIPRDFLKPAAAPTGQGGNDNKGLLLMPGGQGYAVMEPNEYVSICFF